MDLLTPTDHAGAYEWASVFLAHFAIGLFLTAVVAAVLDALDSFRLNIGDTAAAIVTGVYLVAWEMGLQRLGAGWPDALVDTLAVGLGGVSGLFLWRRNGHGLAAALALGVAVLLRGVGMRK